MYFPCVFTYESCTSQISQEGLSHALCEYYNHTMPMKRSFSDMKFAFTHNTLNISFREMKWLYSCILVVETTTKRNSKGKLAVVILRSRKLFCVFLPSVLPLYIRMLLIEAHAERSVLMDID
jgi:hypothetical protein